MAEHVTHTDQPTDGGERSFAQSALEMAGKSADEAERVGAVDRADDVVEAMFEERFQTAHSPLHRAVWGDTVPVELFEGTDEVVDPQVERVMKSATDPFVTETASWVADRLGLSPAS